MRVYRHCVCFDGTFRVRGLVTDDPFIAFVLNSVTPTYRTLFSAARAYRLSEAWRFVPTGGNYRGEVWRNGICTPMNDAKGEIT